MVVAWLDGLRVGGWGKQSGCQRRFDVLWIQELYHAVQVRWRKKKKKKISWLGGPRLRKKIGICCISTPSVPTLYLNFDIKLSLLEDPSMEKYSNIIKCGYSF
jgi:hypothetical protein